MEPEEIGLLLGRIDGKLDGVMARLDKQNGRLDRAEDAIGGLRVRDAYWAGALAVVALAVKMLFG